MGSSEPSPFPSWLLNVISLLPRGYNGASAPPFLSGSDYVARPQVFLAPPSAHPSVSALPLPNPALSMALTPGYFWLLLWLTPVSRLCPFLTRL